MPAMGEITTRDKVGLRGRSRIIWNACPSCGKERWTLLSLYRKRDGVVLCSPCQGRIHQQTELMQAIRKAPKPWLSERQRGEKNHGWRGGTKMHRAGYRYVLLALDDFLRPMADANGYVFEHRLVVARALGRPLEQWEYVHHLNGVKDDNRLENLELWARPHPSGARFSDYHCPGCHCFESALP